MYHCALSYALIIRKRDLSAGKGTLAIISPIVCIDINYTGYPRLRGSTVSEESPDSLIHPRQGSQSWGSPGDTQNNTRGNSEIQVISHTCA